MCVDIKCEITQQPFTSRAAVDTGSWCGVHSCIATAIVNIHVLKWSWHDAVVRQYFSAFFMKIQNPSVTLQHIFIADFAM